MLLLSPIVLLLSTFMAIVYGYLYLLFTTITEVYESNYGFSQGTVGLTYVGIGVGALAGVFIFGFSSDLIMKKKSSAGEMKPEYRLLPMIPGVYTVPVGRMKTALCLYFSASEAYTCFNSIDLRLDSRETCFLDCTYYWNFVRLLPPTRPDPKPMLTVLSGRWAFGYIRKDLYPPVTRLTSVFRCQFKPTSSTPSPYTLPPPLQQTQFFGPSLARSSLWLDPKCTPRLA